MILLVVIFAEGIGPVNEERIDMVTSNAVSLCETPARGEHCRLRRSSSVPRSIPVSKIRGCRYVAIISNAYPASTGQILFARSIVLSPRKVSHFRFAKP